MGLLPENLQARLKLVGNWDSPDLPAALSTIPGWDRVDFVGPLGRAEVAGELQKAYAGLVILHPEPNYVASQPVKLFEYMCAGIPVIVSDFPVCREIVAQARCGILVNPLDPAEIASAMEFLLTHPGRSGRDGPARISGDPGTLQLGQRRKNVAAILQRIISPRRCVSEKFGGQGANRVKFLILSQFFAPEIGASQVRLAYFCRELAAAGHEVEIVTGMPHHPAGRIFPDYQRPLLSQGRMGRPHHSSRVAVCRERIESETPAELCIFLPHLPVRLWLAPAKPDYIFVDSPPLFLGVPGWIAAKLWNVPLVFNVADLWPDSVRDLGVMRDGLLVDLAYRARTLDLPELAPS